jgi:hypothetical protein
LQGGYEHADPYYCPDFRQALTIDSLFANAIAGCQGDVTTKVALISLSVFCLEYDSVVLNSMRENLCSQIRECPSFYQCVMERYEEYSKFEGIWVRGAMDTVRGFCKWQTRMNPTQPGFPEGTNTFVASAYGTSGPGRPSAFRITKQDCIRHMCTIFRTVSTDATKKRIQEAIAKTIEESEPQFPTTEALTKAVDKAKADVPGALSESECKDILHFVQCVRPGSPIRIGWLRALGVSEKGILLMLTAYGLYQNRTADSIIERAIKCINNNDRERLKIFFHFLRRHYVIKVTTLDAATAKAQRMALCNRWELPPGTPPDAIEMHLRSAALCGLRGCGESKSFTAEVDGTKFYGNTRVVLSLDSIIEELMWKNQVTYSSMLLVCGSKKSKSSAQSSQQKAGSAQTGGNSQSSNWIQLARTLHRLKHLQRALTNEEEQVLASAPVALTEAVVKLARAEEKIRYRTPCLATPVTFVDLLGRVMDKEKVKDRQATKPASICTGCGSQFSFAREKWTPNGLICGVCNRVDENDRRLPVCCISSCRFSKAGITDPGKGKPYTNCAKSSSVRFIEIPMALDDGDRGDMRFRTLKLCSVSWKPWLRQGSEHLTHSQLSYCLEQEASPVNVFDAIPIHITVLYNTAAKGGTTAFSFRFKPGTVKRHARRKRRGTAGIAKGSKKKGTVSQQPTPAVQDASMQEAETTVQQDQVMTEEVAGE